MLEQARQRVYPPKPKRNVPDICAIIKVFFHQYQNTVVIKSKLPLHLEDIEHGITSPQIRCHDSLF